MATYRRDLQKLLRAYNRRRVDPADEAAMTAFRASLVAAVDAWAAAPKADRLAAFRLGAKYKGGRGPTVSGLRSGDRRLATLLRELHGADGAPLLDVAVATVTQTEEGPSEYEMNASWGAGCADNKPRTMTNREAKRLYWAKHRRGGFAGRGGGCSAWDEDEGEDGCGGDGGGGGETHEMLEVDSRTIRTTFADADRPADVPADVWYRLRLAVPDEFLDVGWGARFDAANSDEEYDATGGECMGTPRVTYTYTLAALVVWPRTRRGALLEGLSDDSEGEEGEESEEDEEGFGDDDDEEADCAEGIARHAAKRVRTE